MAAPDTLLVTLETLARLPVDLLDELVARTLLVAVVIPLPRPDPGRLLTKEYFERFFCETLLR